MGFENYNYDDEALNELNKLPGELIENDDIEEPTLPGVPEEVNEEEVEEPPLEDTDIETED